MFMLISDDTTVLCWATLNNLSSQVFFPDPEVGISGGSVNFILRMRGGFAAMILRSYVGKSEIPTSDLGK